MNSSFRFAWTTFALIAGLLLASCSSPQPIIIVVTATPLPTLPPTAVPITPPPFGDANANVNPPTPIPSNTPPPPPPTNTSIPLSPTTARPTATPFLPELGVFDQGGGGMEVTMFGPKIANKLVAFRAIVCNPDCRNRPDGHDVNTVKFTFYKWNTQGAGQKGAKVYEHTEGTAPYCSFAGSGQCDFIDLSDRSVKWPGTNTVIDNGEYYFEVTAAGKNNRNWNGNFRFRVQR